MIHFKHLDFTMYLCTFSLIPSFNSKIKISTKMKSNSIKRSPDSNPDISDEEEILVTSEISL